jgi:hypothetical protein
MVEFVVSFDCGWFLLLVADCGKVLNVCRHIKEWIWERRRLQDSKIDDGCTFDMTTTARLIHNDEVGIGSDVDI